MKVRVAWLPCNGHQSTASLKVDGFGDWLAGFADGEGCFYLSCTKGGSHRCNFRLKLRRDDRGVLELAATRTGLGSVYDVKKYQAEWMVVRKADCARLVEIFETFPLRAKKSRDFVVWAQAVALLADVRHVVDGRKLRRGQGSQRHQYQAKLAVLRKRLAEVRRVA